jgi:hypothetical protein
MDIGTHIQCFHHAIVHKAVHDIAGRITQAIGFDHLADFRLCRLPGQLLLPLQVQLAIALDFPTFLS